MFEGVSIAHRFSTLSFLCLQFFSVARKMTAVERRRVGPASGGFLPIVPWAWVPSRSRSNTLAWQCLRGLSRRSWRGEKVCNWVIVSPVLEISGKAVCVAPNLPNPSKSRQQPGGSANVCVHPEIDRETLVKISITKFHSRCIRCLNSAVMLLLINKSKK